MTRLNILGQNLELLRCMNDGWPQMLLSQLRSARNAVGNIAHLKNSTFMHHNLRLESIVLYLKSVASLVILPGQ